MSRDLTGDMQSEVQAPVLRPVLLVKLDYRTAPVFLWNGFGPLDWNGDQYTGAGTLLSLNSIEEATDGHAAAASISLSGIGSNDVAIAYSDEYQGRTAQIWIGAMDEDNALIDDPFLVLSGIMDSLSDSDDGQEVVYTLVVQSALLDQRRVRAWRLTDELHKQLFPNDKGMEFVSSLPEKRIRFGSA